METHTTANHEVDADVLKEAIKCTAPTRGLGSKSSVNHLKSDSFLEQVFDGQQIDTLFIPKWD